MDVQLTGLEVSKSTLQSKKDMVKKETTTQTVVQINVRTDTFEHAQPKKKVAYDNPSIKPDMKTIQQLKEESDRAFDHLKLIVRDMLKRQGLKFRDIEIAGTGDAQTDDEKPGELFEVEVDETARKEAQAMIDEGGECCAAKVSDRIVDFAKAISGGDKSKLDLIKDAIEKGFEAAGAEFDGKLPEICEETHELIMAKLDAWAKEDETPESPAEDKNDCKTA